MNDDTVLAREVLPLMIQMSAIEAIPVVLTSIKEKDRRIVTGDHAQGLYLASVVLHAAMEDLGGRLPEKGAKLRVSDDTGFLRDYYIAKSGVEMGMLRLELEGIDE